MLAASFVEFTFCCQGIGAAKPEFLVRPPPPQHLYAGRPKREVREAGKQKRVQERDDDPVRDDGPVGGPGPVREGSSGEGQRSR